MVFPFQYKNMMGLFHVLHQFYLMLLSFAPGHWKALPNGISGVGLNNMMVAVMIDSATATRNNTLAIINDLESDLSYLANYGYLISLDMVITNQLDSPAPIYVSLQVWAPGQRKDSLGNLNSELHPLICSLGATWAPLTDQSKKFQRRLFLSLLIKDCTQQCSTRPGERPYDSYLSPQHTTSVLTATFPGLSWRSST